MAHSVYTPFYAASWRYT